MLATLDFLPFLRAKRTTAMLWDRRCYQSWFWILIILKKNVKVNYPRFARYAWNHFLPTPERSELQSYFELWSICTRLGFKNCQLTKAWNGTKLALLAKFVKWDFLANFHPLWQSQRKRGETFWFLLSRRLWRTMTFQNSIAKNNMRKSHSHFLTRNHFEIRL